MKLSTPEDFKKSLFAEADGSKFARLKDKFIKTFGESNKHATIETLMLYAREGQLLHWRNFLLTDIIDLLPLGKEATAYASFFEWAIQQPKLSYWSVDGLIKTKGADSYGQLVELIQTDKYTTEVKAKAIKSLGTHSRQPFDGNLPSDPGYWKQEQLPINKVLDWQANGYPEGVGHTTPVTHPSLKKPVTDLGKAAAKLEKKLAKIRSKHQDLSNPSNWLAIASETDISDIQSRWTLPANYLHFLQQYSPIQVFIDSKKYFQRLNLYGATELLERQNGYSYNPVTNTPIEDWPANLIVIADAGADPYCIDIAAINGDDAPIYTSMHGTGKWEFELYAKCFLDFLKELAS